MSSELWLIVAGTAVVTAVIKATGPIALGGRELPPRAAGVIGLLASALLAALIVTEAFADGDRLALGPQTAGVVVAGIAFARDASILVGVGLAVVVTALLRAVS